MGHSRGNLVQVPYDHLKNVEDDDQSEGELTIDYNHTTLQWAYLFTEKFPLLLVDFIIQVSSCDERRGEDFNSTCWSHLKFGLRQYFLTVAILQLNKERVLIHEVIKVSNDVVVLQHGEDAYFIRDISAFLFRERIQVHLLPHHQRVVLGRRQWREMKHTGDRKANKRDLHGLM